jgi:hypothetical protein
MKLTFSTITFALVVQNFQSNKMCTPFLECFPTTPKVKQRAPWFGRVGRVKAWLQTTKQFDLKFKGAMI